MSSSFHVFFEIGLFFFFFFGLLGEKRKVSEGMFIAAIS